MTSGGTEYLSLSIEAVEICDLLTRLGVTANYAGFHQSAYAVYLAVENPERLRLVSKWLYPETAKRCHTTWTAVERNLRTAVRLAWEDNPQLLCELAGCELTSKPKAAQFIGILAYHIFRKHCQE